MSLFDPRTFSTDWELFVVDRLHRCVETRHLLGFAGQLNDELDLPIMVDKDSLEFPLGINTSFRQLRARIIRTTDRAAALLAGCRLNLYPAGAHPVERRFCGGHIHVGTLADESAGLRLEHRLFACVPALAALAANAPASHGRWGAFKSYRVRDCAHGDIRPGMWCDPAVSQRVWGDDAGPKLNYAPTLEVRIVDAPSSRALLAELVVFTAAVVQAEGARLGDEPPDPEAYRDYLVNRWTAARDGLQATFRRRGRPVPAVEVLAALLDGCEDALRALGASRRDLPIITRMLEKRFCQADLLAPLHARYPDPYQLAGAHGQLLRHWTWFEETLDAAAPLDPRPMVDEAALLAAHLRLIGEGSHVYRTREAMALPPPAADAVLQRLRDAGLVTLDFTPARGYTLSRIPGRAGP